MQASKIPFGHIGKSKNGGAIILICENDKVVFLHMGAIGDIRNTNWLTDDYEDMGPFYVDFKEEVKYVPVLKNLGD